MTLIYKSGFVAANSSGGGGGSGGSPPKRCSSPIGYCPDCAVVSENVDTSSSSASAKQNILSTKSTSTSSSPASLQHHYLADRMKTYNIRLSLEDLTSAVNLKDSVTTSSLGRCGSQSASANNIFVLGGSGGFNKNCSTTRRKHSELKTTSDDNNNTSDINSDIKKTMRSILKKSASADSASIAKIRDSLLATRRLSISLSDNNLSQYGDDGDDHDDNDDHVYASGVCRPRSPSKSVTFADDNNQSLVEIHNFVPSSENLESCCWQPFHPATNFRVNSRLSGTGMSPVAGNKSSKSLRKPMELLLCFKEPRDNPDFMERFQDKCVALERCATRDRTLTGIVLVKNLEYEKHVSVRYTVDHWRTTADVEACYVPNSNDQHTDRFSFTLSLPKSYKEMEFAVRYKTSSKEYWDNNFNRNYKVKDALSPF